MSAKRRPAAATPLARPPRVLLLAASLLALPFLALPLLALPLLAVPAARGQEPSDAPQGWLGLTAGGLRFDLARPVTVERQELQLTPQRIEVHYRLANAGAEPLLQTLRFPFPSPFPGLTQPEPPVPPTSRAFADATLSVGGARQPIATVRTLLFNAGQDVTPYLPQAGLDLKGLADEGLQSMTRVQYRRLERALLDAGRPRPQRFAWSLVVEPEWQVALPPQQATEVVLSYTPYPGLSVDRFLGGARLQDLGHLEAYCADEQPALLAWMQARIAGAPGDDGRGRVDVQRHELAYRWEEAGPGWEETALRIEVRDPALPPAAARIAFCFPGGVARLPDGTHLAGGFGRPAEPVLEVVFLE